MAGTRWTAGAAFSISILMFWATVAFTAHVPLLIWSSDSLPPLASPVAGHITSGSELSAFLSSALGSKPHTVLLFLQDKLSQDDFTVYGGVYGNPQNNVFKNLQAALQTPSSVTFPALECAGASAVPAMLEKILGVSPVLIAPDTLPDLKIDSPVNNLLLINLPYCSPDRPCREVLKNNDETIGHVVKTLESKNIPYTTIFTGLQPSRVIAEPALSKESVVGRSLLQAPAPTPVKPPIRFPASGNPCIMLWAQNLFVSVTPETNWTDLASLNQTSVTGSCGATNSSFSMSQQFYPVSARNWSTLDSVELQWNGLTALYKSRHIATPAEYSYHCQTVTSLGDGLLEPANVNASTSNWKLNFVEVQIQGFGLKNGTNFSYASDCAGFFTPGIWMGLLTSLLMLLILVYGLHMILQLSTMDRFDDPKGPSISVPQTE